MPDYTGLLLFLAENPPDTVAERNMHASLLELLATCLRPESESQDRVQPGNHGDAGNHEILQGMHGLN